jgi:hypothetical protein
MGRRELLLILAFVVVGVVAYQLTAPSPKEGERGLSPSRIWDNMRREMRGNAGNASYTHRGSIPVAAEVTQLRISNAHSVVITGEARRDVAYELTVRSRAEDDTTALELAKATAFRQDDLGNSVAFRVTYPRGGQQTAAIVLKVPSHLAIRVESGGPAARAQVSGVASVDLGGISGETSVTDTPGGVSGTHQRGDLTVSNVGSVNLTLTNSQATFTGVQKGLTIIARSSTECRITGSQGPLIVDENNAEITVTGHAGPIRVTGTSGRVTIDRPQQEVKVDTRRAEIEVTLAAAVPMTLLTTAETLRVLLDGPPVVTIDAIVTDGGHIQAGDFNLTPEGSEQEFRLTHSFGSDRAPRLALRNQNADIVIRRTK